MGRIAVDDARADETSGRTGAGMASRRGNVRRALLDAAGALMSERDTLDIPLSDIAERAGANAAMVKYYFGNKEGMLIALLERDSHTNLEQLRRLLATSLDPAEKMRRHLSGIIRTYFRRPYINRLLLAVVRDLEPERRKATLDRLTLPLVETYRELLAEGQALGIFKPVDPMFFYFEAVGICEQLFSGRVILANVFGIDQLDRAGQQAFIDQTIDILMAGIAARPDDGTPGRG